MLRKFFYSLGAVAILAGMGLPAQAQNAGNRNDQRGEEQGEQANQGQNQGQNQGRGNAQDAEPEQSPGFQPSRIADDPRASAGARAAAGGTLEGSATAITPPPPNEFENYVARMTGKAIPRFGADLLLPSARDFARPADATIPPDYRLNVGDVVAISLTGSAEGSVERTIDQRGKIFLPSVGEIQLAGVRQGDLKDVLMRAIGTQFRNFRVGVRTLELRGLRVFVTGYPRNPGAFSVGSLSTAFNALLQAGGPAAGGSMRSARLVRDGRQVADIDLYDILLNGDRSKDAVLENEDVIVVPPTLPQFAIWGSVQREAVFEMRGGETLADALRFAGGMSELADKSRVLVYSAYSGSNAGPRVVNAAEFATTIIRAGDIVQVLPEGSLTRPIAEQSVLVRIEGEVNKPGNYFVAPNTPLEQVVAMAGGLTNRAYPFGTQLRRSSVAGQQKRGFEEAINLFELALATAPLNADSSGDQRRQLIQAEAARATLAKLRETEPDGRLVLEVAPNATTLPGELLLENGDLVLVPPRPTSVGVFGAVYRPASFHITEAAPRRVRDYVDQAGGTLRAADKRNVFVVRANGGVLTRHDGALNATVLPGDVVFVPIKTSSRDVLAKISQLASIVFQFGLAAATVEAITR